MLRRTGIAAALAAMMLLSAALLHAEGPNKVQDKDLEGKWELTSSAYNGMDTLPPATETYSFAGDENNVTLGREVTKGTFKADASKSPKTIDMTTDSGPQKGKTSFGIYEVKGDELRICIPLPKPDAQPTEKDRPTEISTKEGSGTMVMTFKRVKK